jgi:transducin (beta)-like 1
VVKKHDFNTILAGFSHSAFCFAHESLIARTTVADAEVPPAALVAFLQKGLQYCEIEYHLTEDGQERPCDEPFHLLRPHLCRTTRGGSTGKKKDAPDAAQGL